MAGWKDAIILQKGAISGSEIKSYKLQIVS
jgi:hypothetical protein